jgi:hypothetical protein
VSTIQIIIASLFLLTENDIGYLIFTTITAFSFNDDDGFAYIGLGVKSCV